MKKIKINKSVLLGVIAVLSFSGIAIYFLSRKKDTEKESVISSGVSIQDDRYPLKFGSRGENVTILQTKMNLWMKRNWQMLNVFPIYQYGSEKGLAMPKIVVDGIFGKNTREYVKFIFNKETITESDLKSL